MKELINRHKSQKTSEKNLYKVRNPKKRMSLNVYQQFCITHHKGRWIVAFTEDTRLNSRAFKSCHTINRSQAIQLINFLSEYINLVKPTDATRLQASIKASTNRTVSVSKELAAIAIGVEQL